MTLDQVRTFLEIAATGSFIAAAARLHVTQSTVSARVRALEELLGHDLFVRNKAGAVLTPAGMQFQRHAGTLMRTWEQARQDVAIPQHYRALLRIGGEAGLWNRLLYRWVPWMRAQASDVALRCELGLPDRLVASLVEGILDIAVLYTPQSRPGLTVELLTEDDLILVEADAPRGCAAPADYIHVDWGREFHLQHRMRFPDAATPPLSVGLGTLGFDHLVRHGGSGYFPRRLVQPQLDAGEIRAVPDAPAFTLPVYVVHPAEGDRSIIDPALRGLREIVGE